MRRREFITALGSAALAWPLAARAQQAGRIPVVGVLWHGADEKDENPWFGYHRQAFAELGYIAGKNIVFEDRYGAENPERFIEQANELTRLKVDVIMSNILLTTTAAQKATSSIPIVFMVSDPIRQNVVANLAHPGGNATGLSYMNFDLDGKRLQILKRAIPTLSRVGLLLDPVFKFQTARDIEEYEAAAQKINVTIEKFEARNEGELKSACSRMTKSDLDGLILGTGVPFFAILKTEIAKMALDAKLPTASDGDYWADAGALLSYSFSTLPLYRLQASLVKRILAGEKPGDLPVQQPTKFELILNMKTANALGLSVSPDFLQIVDRVIE